VIFVGFLIGHGTVLTVFLCVEINGFAKHVLSKVYGCLQSLYNYLISKRLKVFKARRGHLGSGDTQVVMIKSLK